MKKFFCFLIAFQVSITLFLQRVAQSIKNNSMTLSFTKDSKNNHFYLVVKNTLSKEQVIWHENSFDETLAIEGMRVDTNKCCMLIFTWTGCRFLFFEKNTEGVWEMKIFALIRPFENIPPFRYASEKLIDMETIELTYTDGKVVTYLVNDGKLVKK